MDYSTIKKFILLCIVLFIYKPGFTQSGDILELKNQIKALQQTVESLKTTVEQQQKTIDRLTTSLPVEKSREDKSLEEDIQKALGQPTPSSTSPASSAPTQTGGVSNPAISVVGTFDANWTNDKHLDFRNSMDLSELELTFDAAIDPYAKANAVVTFGADGSAEVEEAYLTSLNLPAALQLQVGKFKSNFDKISFTHRHAWPFADTPNVINNFLGEEGLNEQGVQLSWLVPNPWDYYIEVSGGVSRQSNDVSFNGGDTNDKLYVTHLKSFFDLSPSQTLEVGVSGASGINDPDGHERTNLEGLDLTYKWKPLKANTYKSFMFQNQFLFSQREQPAGNMNAWGFYSYAGYQLAQQWVLGGRYDYSQFPDDNKKQDQAGSAILTFKPTEFQDIRLQYKHTIKNYDSDSDALYFEWVWVIGAHGAHAY